MRYIIENEKIRAEIESNGAELKSLLGVETKTEYMWCADSKYYGRTSPNLFPIVGSLRNGTYRYQGKTYRMNQHGFVRDMEWTMVQESRTLLLCELTSNEETRSIYPFDFSMQLRYELTDSRLRITWTIRNEGEKNMYYSCGFHPCFACPIHGESGKTGYGYNLHMQTNAVCHDIDYESGLALHTDSELELEDGKVIFTPDFFDKGTYVIEHNQTQQVSLMDLSGRDYLTVRFDAPLFAFWSAEGKNAPYAAIEPWFGMCDGIDFDGTLEEREWGNQLAKEETAAHFCEIEIA